MGGGGNFTLVSVVDVYRSCFFFVSGSLVVSLLAC